MHEEPINLNEDYVVYPDGRIWSKRSKKFLKPVLSKAGYLTHSPSVTKGKMSPTVHRILAHCYLGGLRDGLVVNHKDGDKLNNNLDNLELVTYSENSKHARRTGLIRKVPSEENAMAKLTNGDILDVYALMKDGKSNEEVAEIHNLHPRYVSLIRHGKRWSELYKENGPFPKSAKVSPTEEKYKRFLEIGGGKTNAELGRLLDIDASTISRWRSNGRRVR